MSHTNTTTNFGLPQFITTDKPAWLTDVNVAYNAIDTAMKNNQDAASAAQGDATLALGNAADAATAASGADAKASGAIASISENFETTNTYNVGDLVIYNNLLYKCIAAVTIPGAWTGSTNWTRADVDTLITGIDTRLKTAESNITSIQGSIPTKTSQLTNDSIKSWIGLGTIVDNGAGALISAVTEVVIIPTPNGSQQYNPIFVPKAMLSNPFKYSIYQSNSVNWVGTFSVDASGYLHVENTSIAGWASVPCYVFGR